MPTIENSNTTKEISNNQNVIILTVLFVTIFVCLGCISSCLIFLPFQIFSESIFDSTTVSASTSSRIVTNTVSKGSSFLKGDEKFSIQLLDKYHCNPIEKVRQFTDLNCFHNTEDITINITYESVSPEVSLEDYIDKIKADGMPGDTENIEIVETNAYNAYQIKGSYNGSLLARDSNDWLSYVIVDKQIAIVLSFRYDRSSKSADQNLADFEKMVNTLIIK